MNDSEYTMTSPLSALAQASSPLLGLTILWHPVPARVGEQFIGPGGEGVIALSRFLPLFRKLGGEGNALGERCIGRDPVQLRRDAADGVEIVVPQSRMAVELNGRQVAGTAYLSRDQVTAGAVLVLGGAILICVHWMHTLPKTNPMREVIGVSSAAIRMRELIAQVAGTTLPVLLLGETGTGKEVAAQAIHRASKRAGGPLVSVNMATLSESLAAGDLFGAVKGAYSGLQHARQGLFAEADGGTLFLDEIGDTPAAIQPMLLRVLESGEYRPLGARVNAHSSARLVAATDQDLEAQAFNQPLLRRLEAFVIRIPPLRERREDLGLLILHFAAQWQHQDAAMPALPPALVAQMCNHDWPGNVRQLANVVRRIGIGLSVGDMPTFDALAGRQAARQQRAAPLADAAADDPQPVPRDGNRRVKLADLGDADIIEAMENSEWQISGASQELGISRPSLYKLLESHPLIRRVEAIPAAEIEAALAAHGGHLGRCASALRTPSEALRRHLRLMGLV